MRVELDLVNCLKILAWAACECTNRVHFNRFRLKEMKTVFLGIVGTRTQPTNQPNPINPTRLVPIEHDLIFPPQCPVVKCKLSKISRIVKRRYLLRHVVGCNLIYIFGVLNVTASVYWATSPQHWYRAVLHYHFIS